MRVLSVHLLFNSIDFSHDTLGCLKYGQNLSKNIDDALQKSFSI